MEDFYASGSFNKNFNVSFITLVTKCCGPSKLSDFRPISLVSSIYKILSKVLANRLKKVMSFIIGLFQFSFIKGRQILDCSIITNEIVDWLRKSNSGGLLFKVDFEKAFNSVNWVYLDFIMSLMGFSSKWRGWIHQCLSTASISVLVNGSPTL